MVTTPDAGEAEGLIQELARRGLSTEGSTGESVVFSFSTDGPNAGDADEMVRDVVRTARQRAGLLEVDVTSPRWALEQNGP